MKWQNLRCAILLVADLNIAKTGRRELANKS